MDVMVCVYAMCQKAVAFHVEFVITNRLVCYSAFVSLITSYFDSEYILQRIHLLAACKARESLQNNDLSNVIYGEKYSGLGG